jgi:hypothetical protein
METHIQRVADLVIDTDSNVTGSVRFIMTGEEALRWRQLALRNDEEEVKKQFNESIRTAIPDGVQADFDHFLALDNNATNLVAIVKVSGNMGSATGKRFFLPGLFFESRAAHPFVAENKREEPIDVQYPRLIQDEVVYRLPEGYSVEGMPQATNLTWANSAMLRINAAVKDKTVNVFRTFGYNYTLLDAKSYGELHDFYQKIAAADQQQIVLTRAPAAPAKGN